MKLARLGPRVMIIRMDTSLFSPPLSPRTRDGSPYFSTPCKNVPNTVEDLLSVCASNATTWIALIIEMYESI